MKDFVKKSLIIGIVCLLMLVTIPTSLSDNVTEPNDNETQSKAYFFCMVKITGVGNYFQAGPAIIGWQLDEGSVSMRSIYSRDSETGEMIFFDNYISTEPESGVFSWFFGKKSNEPFELNGLAIWGLIDLK